MKAGIVLTCVLTAACGPKSPPTSEAKPLEAPRLARAVEKVSTVKAWYAAADDARETIVTADNDRRFGILHRGEQRTWPMRELMADGNCAFGRDTPMLGYLDVGVSGDGREAWFLGMDGSKRPPTWTLTAACIVDVATGVPRSLRHELGDPVHLRREAVERDRLPNVVVGRHVAVLWGASDSLEIVDRGSRLAASVDIGMHAGDCGVREAGTELTVACVTNPDEGRVTLLRIDVGRAPARVIGRTTAVVKLASPALSISTDGRYVAFYPTPQSRTGPPAMGILDVRDGTMILDRLVRRAVSGLDILPARRAMLVTYDDGPTAIVGFDGREQDRFDLGCRPRALFAAPDGSRLWCLSYSDGLTLFATSP